ncbi:subtilisin-like protein [Dentipellis sp. KUC8613]|nr:subtilisin-like protein [Dentipellis sp. KUC8613]
MARSTHVMHRRDSPPGGFVRVGPAPDEHVLKLHLALAQSNITGMQEKLLAASTPGNAQYGKYLSSEEISSFVAPSSDAVSAVAQWLSSHNLTSSVVSVSGDLHELTLTVKQANEILSANYSTFTDQKTGIQTIRTLQYSIPVELQGHLTTVYPTVQFPAKQRAPSSTFSISRARLPSAQKRNIPQSCDLTFTPDCAIDLYGIPKAIPAQMESRLAVAGLQNQNANYADLKMFLDKYRPDIPDSSNFTEDLVSGGYNNQTGPGRELDLEGNLDIQYTVGLVSPTVPVVFVDVGDVDNIDLFMQLPILANALLNQTNPPQVLSISYGLPESFVDAATATSICNSLSQLSARGITVLAGSGDDGVAGYEDPSECHKFNPYLPAGCPYVTAVGGTMSVNPEVAWDTSGGGFSDYFAMPSWQVDAVSAFVKTLPAGYDTGRFNTSNRGYPDLSARATFAQIALNGTFESVNGTSLSTPVMGSILALLNAELIQAGKAALGFLNPFIYANQDAFTDITAGSNPSCNSDGFSAIKGWDAVTGFGSPNYSKLRAAAGLS